ncbi:MAG: hypothetical protein GX804_07165 [Lentisphaerae bacterium]|jgi:hypothetical protein|nr:hypothetical protein [Lentisphaerota bacterium]
MKYKFYFLITVVVLFACGCIVNDDVSVLTINPDGSADLVVFCSNIHSTEKGEKGREEVAGYCRAFDARSRDDMQRLTKAGAVIKSAEWIDKSVPMSNLLQASFPDLESLKSLLNFSDSEGKQTIKPKYTFSNGVGHFSVQVEVNEKDIPDAQDATARYAQFKRDRANSISEMRIAIAGGKITEASGLIVARDGQSALIDSDDILEKLRTNKGKAEFFMQWEIEE